MGMCVRLQEPEGRGVRRGHQIPLKLKLQIGVQNHLDAGNQTQAFCESNQHSNMQSRLSSPNFTQCKYCHQFQVILVQGRF